MNPFKMTPAYRYGASTPWGGEALREVFGKPIPDSRTGESLEVSALPGLCSRDAEGTPLDVLLERHGTELRGTAIGERFPLLLKLLDARDRLSVQVHPDDAYAAEHEQGKLGKTEAWVILAAEPGAQLIYGLNPSVDSETLRQALGNPEELEACLNRVYVQPGEVFYIPAGMVHAIGGGILLYEIQQSSDVTYRFWDWMRRDAKGNLRELHVEDALAVTRTGLWMESLAGVTTSEGRSSRTLYIADENFALERLSVRGQLPLDMDGSRFALLTALGGGKLQWEDGELGFQAGETVLMPASAPPCSLSGYFDLLMSYVPDRESLICEYGPRAVEVAGLVEPV